MPATTTKRRKPVSRKLQAKAQPAPAPTTVLGEEERMLAYIDGQVANGMRDPKDAKLLLERRADILRKRPDLQRPLPTPTTNEEATMPRKPRSTAAATETTTTTTPSNGRAKAPAFTLTKKDATAIAKRLRGGETMKSIREEFGHSDGSKVRAALRTHGFGSKGQPNPDGLTPTEWREKYGNSGAAENGQAAKTTRAKAKAAEAEAEEPEDDDEDEEETAQQRRARLRRERRAAKKAEAEAAAKPAPRKRRPRAKAGDPS